MEFIEVSAKTKTEAITKASIQLETSSDQLEIQVVSEGSSGFLGIGSKPVIIKARVKSEDELKAEAAKEEVVPEVKKAVEKVSEAPIAKPAEKPAEKPVEIKKTPEKVKKSVESVVSEKPVKEQKASRSSKPIEIITDEDQIQKLQETAKVFLTDVFEKMDMEVEITSKYNKEDGSLEVEFAGEDMGILIGKRGQTLDSLQYLTSLVVNKEKDSYIRVKLDTENYRDRRKETLENLARGIAYKVKKSRKSVVLEPMNPYERRIIHSALQNNKFVETTSEGEEPYRHVVVHLKK